MACFDDYITISAATAMSRSGLYATDLPGIDRDLLDGIARATTEDADDIWETIYKRARRNLVSDVSKQLQKNFFVDLKLVTRESSSFIETVNTGTGLAGVTLEFSLPKYAKLHIISVGVNVNKKFLGEWTTRKSALAIRWDAVVFGNGLFVAISQKGLDYGNSNTVMTSPDGITWTLRTSASQEEWKSIAYGNGLFVAVAGSGTGNRVMTSPDGIIWTLRTSATDNLWTSIVYGDELFVAVAGSGTGNRVMTSPDGITWTSRTSAADNGWISITYGNGLYVAVSNDGIGNRVMTSPDGTTWTSRTSAADNQWSSVTYGNGLFVAVAGSGTGNRVMTSPDGIIWTLRTSAADNLWNEVVYGDGLFVAVAFSETTDTVMTSADGITWTLKTDAPKRKWTGLSYSNTLNRFVAVGDSTSTNGVMTAEPNLKIDFYEDDEDGDLLHSVTKKVSSGKNTINIDSDFEVDKIFVSYNPAIYSLYKTENKYFPGHNYIEFGPVVCDECLYGDSDFWASVVQENGGGLNVKYVIYCSTEKFVCENLKLFEDALLYKIGYEISVERRLGERLTKYTVMTQERWDELNNFYKAQYETNIMNVMGSMKIQEDTYCYSCKNTVRTDKLLP